MHAGLLHLGLNTLALAQLGPEAEAVLGPQSFLTIYLLSGLSGSVASFLTSPSLVTVGASGAIFGLLGAACPALFPVCTCMLRAPSAFNAIHLGSDRFHKVPLVQHCTARFCSVLECASPVLWYYLQCVGPLSSSRAASGFFQLFLLFIIQQLMCGAGAIAAYIVKNRQQLTNSNRQLVNIAGIVAANVVLGLGGGNIDNAGKFG